MINVQPQVLLNISSHILTARMHAPHQQQIGIILGQFNARQNKTDISDSFELLLTADELQEHEIGFLKERMELRLTGDRWNLFKHLEILGWYTTSNVQNTKLHQQIESVIKAGVTENSVCAFKYLLCFEQRTTDYQLYEYNDGFAKIESKIEPQTEEMISITSAFQQSANKNKFETRLNEQKQMLVFLEGLLMNIYQDIDGIQDEIQLRNINEILINFPEYKGNDLQQEYCKLTLLSYYCAIAAKLNNKNLDNQINK